MPSLITTFWLDDAGDWVAELSCAHRQHMRHRPPLVERPWVLDPNGRAAHLGKPVDCPHCAPDPQPFSAESTSKTSPG